MLLQISTEKLLEIIGEGTLSVPSSFTINHLTSLGNATDNDIAVLIDRGDASVFSGVGLDAIKKSKAGLIIATQAAVPEKNYCIVKDPLSAFQKLSVFAQQQNIAHAQTRSDFIASSAEIATTAVIKPGTTIGEQSIVMDQVFIGYNCTIGSNVILYPGVKILDNCIVGNHVIIHPGAVIGSDGFGYQVTKQGLRKIPQVGIVRIGNMVEIGANCTIDRASFDETIIEDLVKLDNSVHLAHNVKVGMGTAIIAQTGIAGSTIIGKGCQIGGQVGIRDNITVGDGAKIVSKSAILTSVAPGETLAGIPATSFMQWKKTAVMLTKLPELFKQAQTISDMLTKKKPSWWRRFFTS